MVLFFIRDNFKNRSLDNYVSAFSYFPRKENLKNKLNKLIDSFCIGECITVE